MGRYIEKRKDGRWRLKIRVPLDVRVEGEPEFVRTPLHTDDEAAALLKARAMVAELRAGWDDRRAGRLSDAQARYDAAQRIARRRGFAYLAAADVAAAPPSERLERVRAALRRPAEAPALLGLAAPPPLMLSGLVDHIEARRAPRLAQKSERQRHRQRLPLDRAARNLIAVAGDAPVREIGRAHIGALRAWWVERIVAGDARPVSANRDFEILRSMINEVRREDGLAQTDLFAGALIENYVPRARHPLTSAEIRAHVLPALHRINPDARFVVHVLAQTGLRPSEACNLSASELRLDADIPHIDLTEGIAGRQLKTAQARRRVPLVGSALDMARANPGGVGRYRDREASFSATVGKFLRAAMPGYSRVSAYSFRHGFKDRLRDSGAAPEAQDYLMGHRHPGMGARYGAGPSLESLASLLARIAV